MSRLRALPMARSATATLAAVLLALVLAVPGSADTKSDLTAAQKQLHGLEDQIAAEQGAIAGLQAQADGIAAQRDAIASRIAQTQGKIVEKEAEIKGAQDHLLAVQGQLNRRAWVAYENGPGSNLEFLLGSTSLSDLTDRLEIVNHVAQSDTDLILQIQEQQNKLQAKQAELEALESDLRSTQTELTKQENDLTASLTTEQAVLNQLDTDEATASALVKQLTDKLAAEEEAARLAALERAKQAQQGSISGVFIRCPVNGAVAYSDDFGAPRYGGGFHPHAGNDMFANRGTPVVAPFAGTATDASNGLGGLAVEVTGSQGQGYVYNAHLDTILKLGPVSAGDVVGTVGNSGDAQGGATHDHFEWHPNDISKWEPLHKSPYGYTQIGDAIDPFPFLNSVC